MDELVKMWRKRWAGTTRIGKKC